MRKISRETSHMFNELGELTKWGMQHGIHEKWMISYAFDFYVEDEYTPAPAHKRLAAAKHAALGRGQVDAVLMSSKHHDLQTVTRVNSGHKESYKAPEV